MPPLGFIRQGLGCEVLSTRVKVFFLPCLSQLIWYHENYEDAHGRLRMKFLVDYIGLQVGELLAYGASCLFIAWSTVISGKAIFGKAISDKAIYDK